MSNLSLLQNANHKICIWFGKVDSINAVMIIKSKVIILRSCLYFLADRTEKCRENLTVFLTFLRITSCTIRDEDTVITVTGKRKDIWKKNKSQYLESLGGQSRTQSLWSNMSTFFIWSILGAWMNIQKPVIRVIVVTSFVFESFCLKGCTTDRCHSTAIITIVYIDAAIQLDENAIALHPKLPNTHLCWLNLRWIGKNWNVE